MLTLTNLEMFSRVDAHLGKKIKELVQRKVESGELHPCKTAWH